MVRAFFAIVALTSIFSNSAHADCLAPLANGAWGVRQNNGFVVNFNTTATRDHHFSGSATTKGATGNLSGAWVVGDGKISPLVGAKTTPGVIAVAWKVYWTNGSIGSYSGELDNNGFLRGISLDETHPNSVTGIYSLTQFLRGNLNC